MFNFKLKDEVWFIRRTDRGYAIERGILQAYIEEIHYSRNCKKGHKVPKICYIDYPYFGYPTGGMPTSITINADEIYHTEKDLIEAMHRNRTSF